MEVEEEFTPEEETAWEIFKQALPQFTLEDRHPVIITIGKSTGTTSVSFGIANNDDEEDGIIIVTGSAHASE